MADLPLPVTVIGGYLGSGKTTLVNHLLRHANGRRLAVLVNEFGALAIDEDLIEAQDDELISIAGGCICCSFGSDLAAALMDLSKMTPRPDHILIESSGVAIPGAIVATMSLLDGFQSDGIVVVTDAETLMKSAADDYIGDTITRQLADSEIVVLNKLDLIDATKRESVVKWLAGQAPTAILVPAEHGKVDPSAVLGAVPAPGRGHQAGHSDALFDSMILGDVAGIDAEALARQLAEGPFGVIRAKGFVTIGEGRMALVHTVGQRSQVTEVAATHQPGIVCLGFRGRLDKSGLAGLQVTWPKEFDKPS